MDNGQTATQALKSIERIRPIGAVATAPPAVAQAKPDIKPDPAAETLSHSEVTTPATKPATRTGEEVYQAACAACHAIGVMSAPKFKDKADWSERMAKGVPTLLQHAIKGFQAMPPKGGCATCSDEEIEAAVKYLIDTADVAE
ncbi:hypothetical protein TI03_03525 [Achromatium sp. WMS1]|nr:hypothetical protein TI03_03525 [Achromatium sp. WMS1]